jgi:hypothetical protein
MELILALIFFACISFFFTKGKTSPPSNPQNCPSAQKEESDDFVGKSTDSIFLIEEVIEPQKSGMHSTDSKLLDVGQAFESNSDQEDWGEERL